MEIYKINIKNQFANMDGMLIHAIFLLCGYLGLCYYKGLNTQEINPLGLIFIFTFLLQFIPWIIIHLNYYQANKNDTFIFDDKNEKIIFLSLNNTIEFILDDIKEVIFYKSPPLIRNDIQYFAFDCYNHGVIILHNGARITFTSLMIGGEFVMPLNPERIKIKSRLFRLVKGPSLVLNSAF